MKKALITGITGQENPQEELVLQYGENRTPVP